MAGSGLLPPRPMSAVYLSREILGLIHSEKKYVLFKSSKSSQRDTSPGLIGKLNVFSCYSARTRSCLSAAHLKGLYQLQSLSEMLTYTAALTRPLQGGKPRQM